MNPLTSMSRIIGALCAIATLLTVPLSRIAAQCTATGSPATCTQTGSVTVAAEHIIRIAMSPTSTTLPPPTGADFTAGFKSSTGPTVTVSANFNWSLSIRALTATWVATNTSSFVNARTNKPDDDLTWSTSANGTFHILGTVNAPLATGLKTAAAATTLYYRTLYSTTLDTPGIYRLGVLLSLSAP